MAYLVGRKATPKKTIRTATADLRSIVQAEYPQLTASDTVTVGEMLDIMHTVDVHRQKVENTRADKRNDYRLGMLYSTLFLWVVSAFVLKLLVPAALYPSIAPFTAVVPIGFDLVLQHINKHQKV